MTLNKITPLVIDDGLCSMKDQAQILMKDIGTDREWIAVRLNDEEGFAEVVLLTHPKNASQIVRAVNMLPKLVEALDDMLTCIWIEQPPTAAARKRAAAVLAEANSPEVSQ